MQQQFFGPDFFSQNRLKLRESIGSDMPIVITGNGTMQRGGDEAFPFYQDSNFWYLTGLNGSELTLVMTVRDSYVIVPTMSTTREAFDGAHNIQAYAATSGITSILPEREGWQRLKSDLTQTTTIATLGTPPAYLKPYALYTLPYRTKLNQKLKRLNPSLAFTDIRQNLAQLRVYKQPEELLALQRAIDITGETLQHLAAHSLQSAEYEYQLEAELSYGFRSRGADGHAFAPIVGAGAHSTTLHYLENNGPILADDIIVLDVGADVAHYSADITRTVSRQPLTGLKANVFKAVEAVQDYALSLIKPGMVYREYEEAIEIYMGKQLQSLGLMSAPSHEAIRRYYPHATSHFLGLDTHDVGDYRSPLEAGMVITCEPGIYIPEEGIGVRIEDDILITATGHKVLSQACPRRLTPVQ